MSRPISARMVGRRQDADAGDCAQARDQFAKGQLPVGCLFVHAFDLVSDLLIDLPDRRLERIPLPQMQLQQKTVMVASAGHAARHGAPWATP